MWQLLLLVLRKALAMALTRLLARLHNLAVTVGVLADHAVVATGVLLLGIALPLLRRALAVTVLLRLFCSNRP